MNASLSRWWGYGKFTVHRTGGENRPAETLETTACLTWSNSWQQWPEQAIV